MQKIYLTTAEWKIRRETVIQNNLAPSSSTISKTDTTTKFKEDALADILNLQKWNVHPQRNLQLKLHRRRQARIQDMNDKRCAGFSYCV